MRRAWSALASRAGWLGQTASQRLSSQCLAVLQTGPWGLSFGGSPKREPAALSWPAGAQDVQHARGFASSKLADPVTAAVDAAIEAKEKAATGKRAKRKGGSKHKGGSKRKGPVPAAAKASAEVNQQGPKRKKDRGGGPATSDKSQGAQPGAITAAAELLEAKGPVGAAVVEEAETAGKQDALALLPQLPARLLEDDSHPIRDGDISRPAWSVMLRLRGAGAGGRGSIWGPILVQLCQEALQARQQAATCMIPC
jgi:hypothetical protein